MARASGSVSACTQIPASSTVVDRTSRLNRSFISSPVIRPRLGRDAQIVVRGSEAGQGIGRSYSKGARDRTRAAPFSLSDPLQRLPGRFIVAGQRQPRAIFSRSADLVALFFEELAEKVMGFERGRLLDRGFGEIAPEQLDGK